MSAPGGAEIEAGGRRWRFGSAEFDERSLELRVGGRAVNLERKSLEVLKLLLYRAGEVVTKDELLEAVWPGRIVSESIPPKCVSRIRDVIGDQAQEVIKTVHGYGYRFVAPVTVEAARRAPPPPKLDLEPGDHPPLRPQWRLVQQLGTGGQGEVWLARHVKLQDQRVFKFAFDAAGLVAIKREITLYRFLRDALGARTDFVEVLDWNLEEAPYYLELEYAPAGNLEAWSASQGGLAKLPLTDRLELVARIADALAAAHSVGVLHKDLKPSNVLVTSGPDGTPAIKLTDFGSGGMLDPQRLEAFGITRGGLTRSVAADAPASALYAAPEVMTGQPATVQADLYSLGIILFQIVVGDFRQPLAAGWELQVGDSLLCEDIALAVAGDPARRLADAANLAQRLRALDTRRQQRAAEHAEKLRLEQEQQAATERARKAELAVERLRARRVWQRAVVAVLVVGVSLSLGLYFDARRARNEAAAAAAASRAVADYLSQDLFAQVAAKPRRDLTVTQLIESAAASLNRRSPQLPLVSAQLHSALGHAAMAVENYELAERQLSQALDGFELSGDAAAEARVNAATTLLRLLKTNMLQVPVVLPRFERILNADRVRLGAGHSSTVALQHEVAYARFHAGDWKAAAAEMRRLIDDLVAVAPSDPDIGVHQSRLAVVLTYLGEFEAASAIAQQGLERLRADPNASPTALIEAQTNRAIPLIHREQFREAQALLQATEHLARPWYPDEDGLAILSIRARMGFLALRANRASDAVGLLEQTVSAFDKSDWLKNIDPTAEFRSWLAEAYALLDRPDAARRTMREALAISERHSGLHHPITEHIRVALAGLLVPTDPPAARKLLASVDERVLATLGSDHPYAAERHRVTGLLALREADVLLARARLREALRIFEMRYGADHHFTRRAREELALAQRT